MAVDLPAPSAGGVTTPRPHELPASTGALTRARGWLQARALFVVGVAAVAILSFAGIPSHLGQDGWLALVAGRIIAEHGIPQQHYLTVMAYGVRWTDQQWLAQLVMYLLQQLGGLQLMTVTYVLITTTAFAGALASARRLGAQDRHVLMVLPAGAFFYLATALSIRTQGFAYPLFIATLALLATEFPRAGREAHSGVRAYLVFPLLILWANLHGSVTMGVGIAVLYGIAVLFAGLKRERLAGLASFRGWVFVLLSPLTLFATPYGIGMLHYYRVTLFNSEFAKLVTEWAPTASYPILAIPLFVLIAVSLIVLVRSGRRTPLFDKLVLAMLAAGAIDAVRNITWFGLAVVVLLPPAISRAKHDRPAPLRNARINLIFAVAMICLTGLFAVVTLGRPSSWFQSDYPTRTLSEVQQLVAADPSAKIFADVHYADWLVWRDPSLADRIAYDTSFELLTKPQLQAIAKLAAASAPGYERTLAPYEILVLYPGNKQANRTILRGPGMHTLVRNAHVIIATHPASAAAR